jgi:hypothetical protein
MALQKKRHLKNNIVVGEDHVQVRALERILEQEAVSVDRVVDEDLIGASGLLLRVHAAHKIDLAGETINNTGFWLASKLTKESQGLKKLIEVAASLSPKEKYPKEELAIVHDALLKEEITDLFVTLWRAVSILSGDKIEKQSWWKNPWESTTDWMPLDKVEHRLNYLYKSITQYAIVKTVNEDLAKKQGASPSQVQHWKTLNLPADKVEATIMLLSKWKQGGVLPEICALQISSVWTTNS